MYCYNFSLFFLQLYKSNIRFHIAKLFSIFGFLGAWKFTHSTCSEGQERRDEGKEGEQQEAWMKGHSLNTIRIRFSSSFCCLYLLWNYYEMESDIFICFVIVKVLMVPMIWYFLMDFRFIYLGGCSNVCQIYDFKKPYDLLATHFVTMHQEALTFSYCLCVYYVFFFVNFFFSIVTW